MSPEELQQCRDCLPPDAELRRAWPYRAIVLLLEEIRVQELLVASFTQVWELGMRPHKTMQAVRPFRWAERDQ